MRMAFGLVSILVTFALMLYLMVGTGYTGAVAKQNQQVRSQLNVLKGNDPTGQMAAINSIRLRVDRSSGKPKLLASEVMKNGPMENRYGFKPGDRILEIDSLEFGTNIDSREAAEEFLTSAYSRDRPVVVMRDGQKLTLPTPEHLAAIVKRDRELAAAAAAENASQNPAVNTGSEDNRSAIQKALDGVRTP